MLTFTEILQREMQTEEFDNILEHYLHPSSEEHKYAILQQILDLIQGDPEIRNYTDFVVNHQDSINQEDEFLEVARLALEYLKERIIEFGVSEHKHQEIVDDDLPLEDVHELPVEDVHGLPVEDVHGLLVEDVHGLLVEDVHGLLVEDVHGLLVEDVHGLLVEDVHVLLVEDVHGLLVDDVHWLLVDDVHWLPVEDSGLIPTEQDLTEFDMPDMLPEDEFDLEEHAVPSTVADVWSVLAFRAISCSIDKTAGAA